MLCKKFARGTEFKHEIYILTIYFVRNRKTEEVEQKVIALTLLNVDGQFIFLSKIDTFLPIDVYVFLLTRDTLSAVLCEVSARDQSQNVHTPALNFYANQKKRRKKQQRK